MRLRHDAKDLIRALSKNKEFSFCERVLEIRDVTETARVGWLDRPLMQVRWDEKGSGTLDIRSPVAMDDPDQEVKEHKTRTDEAEDDNMKEKEQNSGQKNPLDDQ